MADKQGIQVSVKSNKPASLSPRERMFSLLDDEFPFFSPFRFTRLPRLYRQSGFADTWSPKVDVAEHDGKLTVKADLPGVRQEDVHVTLDRDSLVIEADRAEEKETKEANYYQCERESGSYYRAITVPDGVTAQAVKAAYKDGVLQVTIDLPKQEEAKKVSIKVA